MRGLPGRLSHRVHCIGAASFPEQKLDVFYANNFRWCASCVQQAVCGGSDCRTTRCLRLGLLGLQASRIPTTRLLILRSARGAQGETTVSVSMVWVLVTLAPSLSVFSPQKKQLSEAWDLCEVFRISACYHSPLPPSSPHLRPCHSTVSCDAPHRRATQHQ